MPLHPFFLIHVLLWVMIAQCWPALAADENISIIVDTKRQELTVYADDHRIKTYTGVAIGRGGTSMMRHAGDGSTPLGSFRVAWINDDSPFHRFFGLNFPDRDTADRAYRDHLISRPQWRAIHAALAQGLPPPANTPLGGRIGIHGLGNADPDIHARFNWTQGCIAVTNEQIDDLAQWLLPGTPVEIR